MNNFLLFLWFLILGLIFSAFLRFLRMRNTGRQRGFCWTFPWTYVVSVDENGDRIGRGRWFRNLTPDSVDVNGMQHIVKYVARLVKSQTARSSLIIATPDEQKACLVIRQGDWVTLYEHVHLGSTERVPKRSYRGPSVPPHAPEPEKEQAVRSLLAEYGIAPILDFVHDYNGYIDAVRDLHFPLGNEVTQITQILQRLLREVYHVQDTEGLNFTLRDD